ncbi:hypothetical protein ACIP3A_14985 [Streptomyces tricolor]|nr:hypothetical protein [Streptomyces sp. PBH53]
MAAEHMCDDLIIEEYDPAASWTAPTDSFICWAEKAAPATTDRTGA